MPDEPASQRHSEVEAAKVTVAGLIIAQIISAIASVVVAMIAVWLAAPSAVQDAAPKAVQDAAPKAVQDALENAESRLNKLEQTEMKIAKNLEIFRDRIKEAERFLHGPDGRPRDPSGKDPLDDIGDNDETGPARPRP